jgi:hypothetical protein
LILGGIFMKNLMILLGLVFAISSYANEEAPGIVMEPEAFEEMMSVETNKAVQFIPWQYSTTVCQAATRCMNGRVISCQTYGFNYSMMPGHLTNQCAWAVWPGRAVRCQGYTQVRDFYGRFMWTYVDVPVSCF